MTAPVFLAFLLTLLLPGTLLLSMDCTTWERGESPLNLLVLGAVLLGYTVPLVWTALDHGGNRGTVRRIQLVSRLLKTLPACRWKGLVADREFIGGEWFRFLRREGIKRAIRTQKNAVIDELRVDAWFGDLKVGAVRCLTERANAYGEVMHAWGHQFQRLEDMPSVPGALVRGMHLWQFEIQGVRPGAHGDYPPGPTGAPAW